jgi:hypothetical protein
MPQCCWSAGDRRQALELLTTALDDANRLGMARLSKEGAALQACARFDEQSPTPVVSEPTADEDASPHEGRFRKEGDYWTIAFEGAVLRLKDARGLHSALARHLAASIRTGASCVYSPDPIRPIR